MQIKYTTLFLLLAGTTAFAQINTNQKVTEKANSNAFLDASENTDNFSNNLGRGLLFPQTDLSTFTLDINAADGINYPTYFDGMIVYNTHEGDATTDPSLTTQTENLEKGFYYFSNPTGKDTQSISNGKWVRISDAQAKAQGLWEKQDNGDIKLVDANLPSNVEYKSYGGFTLSPKEKIEVTYYNPGTWPPTNSNPVGYLSPSSEPYNTTFISSYGHASKIPYVIRTDTDPDYVTGAFKSNSLLVDPDATQHTRGYLALDNSLTVPPENTHDYSILYGVTNYSNHSGKGTIKNVMGVFNEGRIGSPDSKAIRVRGAFNQATSHSSNPLSVIEASFNYVSPRNNGNIANVHGVRNYTSLGDAFSSTISNFVMTKNDFRIAKGNRAPIGGHIQYLYGTFTTFDVPSSSAVIIDEMYGARLSDVAYGQTENYGLYIDNVGNKNAEKNYAIYTGLGTIHFGDKVGIGTESPSSKLQVSDEGNTFIRVNNTGSDVTSRVGSEFINKNGGTLTITNNGSGYTGPDVTGGASGAGIYTSSAVTSGLSIGTTTGALKFFAGGINGEKMRINEEGNVGIGTDAPTEKLEVAGAVKAESFKGSNGATLFPDYVFENYYTGTSTTKADYSFKNLDQVEDYVKNNGHLPGYVSAKEIKAQGYIDIMDTQLTNVEKIEELYLHTIEQEKKIEKQSQEIEELKSLVKQLLNK